MMTRKRPKVGVIRRETWRHAKRASGDYPTASSRSGKWLCFISDSDADEMWEKVAEATKSGRLGSESFMQSARDGFAGRVIEVCTYDWANRDDVFRVRGELRDLGWLSKIPYKSDEDSRSGLYQATGHRRISKYYD